MVQADEAYIRESILHPQAKIVAGYPAAHAHLPGTGDRRGRPAADRIYQIAGAAGSRGRNDSGGVNVHQPSARRAQQPLDHMITAAVQERENYLNASYGLKIVAAHQGPQAHRAAVPVHHHLLLLHRRHLRHADPHRAADAARATWSARTPTTSCSPCTAITMIFFFLIPSIPATAGQFLPADDDRRARPGLSAHQPAELVPAGDRRPVRSCSPCWPAASIPAGRSTRPTAPRTRTPR